MSDLFKNLNLPMLLGTSSVISSPELGAGRLPYNWLAGATDPCGPEAVHVSPSQMPERETESKTNDICGRGSENLSEPENQSLQSRLENKLKAVLDVNGSPEYVLTWKKWEMKLGPSISALRARQRRIGDNEFTGWPSPKATTSKGGDNPETVLANYKRQGRTTAHRLAEAAALAVIPSGWATPTTRDHKDSHYTPNVSENCLLGRQVWGCLFATAKLGVLNPDLSRWLMGYPREWHSFTDTATQ